MGAVEGLVSCNFFNPEIFLINDIKSFFQSHFTVLDFCLEPSLISNSSVSPHSLSCF
jgi:hypothetical protein